MKLLLAIFSILTGTILAAQERSYEITRISQEITVDGKLDEAVWSELPQASGFHQYFPDDQSPSGLQTEFMLAYDDNNLYFAAIMRNKTAGRDYVTPSLRRDYRGEANDGITLIFDSFNDKTNAFLFGVNPYGVQREGLVSSGGQRRGGLDLSWDNKWYAEASVQGDYWTAEVAIPFKTLRYKEGSPTWNFNVYRIDSETGERSSWADIPLNYSIISLAFAQKLVWDQPLDKPGSNISLIPYGSANYAVDYEQITGDNVVKGLAAGMDAKIGIGPSLNLDLTVNPDFSQVEVDQQVTNLNRFEIRFPERRQFFLENADLFGDFGHPFLANPFFSRRIGIARDTVTGQNLQNKINYGLRLSGKLNNNWRIGLLNMQAAPIENVSPAMNYTVAVTQRKVFARSNIGAFLVNQQMIRDSTESLTLSPATFNRNAGIDFNIASEDNRWTGKVFYHHSFDEQSDPGQFAHAGWILFRGRNFSFDWAHTVIGENYEAPTGFAPRKGIVRVNPGIGYTIFPESQLVTNYQFRYEFESYYTLGILNDRTHQVRFETKFSNTAELQLNFNHNYIFLLNPFDPTNTGSEKLNDSEGYGFSFLEFQFRSDARRTTSFSLEGSAGNYYNGTRTRIGGNIDMRVQPILALRMNVDYNRIRLPEPYNSTDLWLLGPRLDFTFTKKLFWTTFIQYNSQLDNTNINTRLQWRFKPVSDFFIVYTDNYFTEFGDPRFNVNRRNRSLILKLTYWLNV